MTTVKGGPLEPIKILTAGDLQENGGDYVVRGRIAQPVYQFSTEDRAVVGGPVTAVYPVTQAQLDSGQFRLSGDPAYTPVYEVTTRPVIGNTALPVFVVSG